MLKLQTLTYIEIHYWTGRIIWDYATGTLTPSKGPDTTLNQIALSISTVEKCAPMQVVKQPENRKASTTKEQKWTKDKQKEQKTDYD